MSCFTVMSYNVCGVNNATRRAELSLYLSSHQPSVIVLQEPKVNHLLQVKRKGKVYPHTPVPVPKFTNYIPCHFTHPSQPTGILFYIHTSCTFMPFTHIPHCTPYRPDETTTVVGFIWVSSPLLPQPVVIAGTYLDGKMMEVDVAAFAKHAAIACRPLPSSPVSSPPLPLFIVGDLNARHMSWDPLCLHGVSTPTNGNWVHKHLIAPTAQTLHPLLPRLTVANTHFTNTRNVATHTSYDGDSVIDLALTSHPQMLSRMDVLTQQVIGSDHLPILITFSRSSSPPVPSHVAQPAPVLDPAPPPSDEEVERKYDRDNDSKYGDVQADAHDINACVVPPPSSMYPRSSPDYFIATSTIPGAGLGLFATRDYKQNEFIIEYCGEAIDLKEKVRRYPHNTAQYVVGCTRNLFIDAVDPALSSDARYINSAGKYNNAQVKISHLAGTCTANVRAKKHIRAGDEIFMPYGTSFHLPAHAQSHPIRRTSPPPPHQHQQQAAQQHAPPPQTERVRWNTTNDADTWIPFQTHLAESLTEWTGKYQDWGNNNTPSTISQTQMNDCWQHLLDIIMTAARECVGIINVRPDSKEWWALAPNIMCLHETYRVARRRRRAVNKAGRVVSIATRVAVQAAYVKAKGEFNKAVREARQMYWQQLAEACDETTPHNKHKLLWSRSKRLMCSARVPAASFCDATGAPPLTPQHAINNMASHLASVSTLAHDPSHDVDHERHVREYLADVPTYPNIHQLPPFDLAAVESVCSSFRLNTAYGSDNVSPFFLRYGGKSLHQALFILFSICSRHGTCPSSFRHGHVVTLYKGEGEVSDHNNYRPITITSVIARVYERLHMRELLDAMTAANLPSLDQFGFTRQRSTHDAVYRLLSHIVDAADGGTGDQRYVPAVFVDISKAYDKVWTEGLLYKLHKLGVTGNLYYTIRSLLMQRTFQVVSEGRVSTIHMSDAGVPQGSILAPLLFLIYIHGITQNSSLPRSIIMSLFADDIALMPRTHGTAGFGPLQRALTLMSEYASRWKITYSVKKTNVVFFRLGQDRRARQLPDPAHTLTLTHFTIKTAPQYTYLGVTLDKYLTFIPHVHALIKRVSCTADMISRLVRRDHLPSFPIIQTLVKCVLIPQMTYSFPFIGSTLEDKVVSTRQATGNPTRGNMYIKLKNAILRPLLYCLGLPHNAHHASVFIESRLLDVMSLVSLTSARLAHRWLSMGDHPTNVTAAMFRAHVTHAPRSAFHPFHRMTSVIRRVGGFSFSLPDVSVFSHLPLDSLKMIAWERQYNRWRMDLPHSVPPYYPLLPTKMDLPRYVHIDTPSTAAHRSRLLFARARFRFDHHRLGFQDVSDAKCAQCVADEDETVEHVISSCAAYDRPRAICARALRALPLRASLRRDMFPLSSATVLVPHYDPNIPSRLLPPILSITGRFIDAVYSIRKDNF